MNIVNKYKKLIFVLIVFLAFYFAPFDNKRLGIALMEALHLAKWYAREHVLLCLVPAFFIAGAISVFLSQASVMKYLGAKANKILAYSVASVSGTILAVCSCTVLPLFAGIYKMGAGLGPAVAFLYSGPAINVLAIVLTARVLGIKLGIARAVGAIIFSIVIGVFMHLIFRNGQNDTDNAVAMPENSDSRPLWKNVIYFGSMIGILVFANWAKPAEQTGLWFTIYTYKWIAAAIFAALLYLVLAIWFGVNRVKLLLSAIIVAVLSYFFRGTPAIPFTAGFLGLSLIISTEKGDNKAWFDSTLDFALKILPLLFAGVLVAGLLLGRQNGKGIIPEEWVQNAVGGNSLWANLFASVAGAFMYFATLTEVPILQGLIESGMGRGPALALLLAGPALSLPNMLVIRSIMGTAKTIVFVLLVIIMATISGIIFGYMC